MKSISERIAYLEQCAKLYETSGNSPLSDAEYDKEYAALKVLVPDNPFFSKVGGIDEEHVYGTKVKHQYIMGSLNKDPNPDEFGVWFGRTFGKNIDRVVALLQPKVDGSSFCLKYQDGKLIQAVSRGDGEYGFDFTPNAMFIKGVNQKISSKGYVEVKGEVYKNRQDFYSENWVSEGYANARNFASGSINQKNPLETKKRGLSFVSYEVRGIDFKTEEDKQKFLDDNGFETLKEYIAKINCSGRTVEDVVRAIHKYMGRFDRNKLPFDVDGIVFKLNDVEWAESLGTSDGGKRPKAHRAVKFPTDQQETILEDIEWSIGRTGALTPVGLLAPVQLAGTTVRRVSIHNLKEMERLGITKTGCKILVEKAGDIIPKIVRVIKEGDKKISIPETCPACNEALEWDETQTTKRCINDSCSSQVNKSIEYWFKTLEVKGIGPGIIEKLTENSNTWPPVKSISDMYNLKQFTSVLSKEFGDRAFEIILEAIDSVKEVPLSKFIEALGIGKIGTMSKEIVAIAPTIEDIDSITIDDIKKISGFAETKAKSFVDGWKKQRKEINNLLKYVKISTLKLDSNNLNNKSFCITGTLSQPRNNIQKMIELNGGKISGSVSAKLDYLICGEDSGSKKEKAEKLGIKIITEKEFLGMIK